MNEWEWQLLEERTPPESVRVSGVELKKGDRVRLRPRTGGDIMDLALDGRIATIESLEQDYEGEIHVSVVIDDDPGSDLGTARQPGHRFFFHPEEVEPVESAPQARVLVAGIGNIFLGDDAFGVEVVRRLEGAGVPQGVRVTDFGIRGYDLAYALTSGYDTAILVDAAQRGDTPGTLYLIEPDLAGPESGENPAAAEAHSMDPLRVLRLAQNLGTLPRRILVLGCEPATFGGEEGHLGLSTPVEAAVDQAIARLRSLLAEEL
jgi:hydrogenase maturation protease